MTKRNDNNKGPSQEELDREAGMTNATGQDNPEGAGNRGDLSAVDQSEAAKDDKKESGEQIDAATGEAVLAGRFRENRDAL